MISNIGYFLAGGTVVLCAWWHLRMRKIRSKFVNTRTNDMIPGSNNFPFVDYILHGFSGRNTLAPYGDFELSCTLGFPVIMVSEPTIVKELLKGDGVKDFDKGELTLAGVEVIAGRQNLFSLDGMAWHQMRGIINPAFRPNLIRLLTQTVSSTVNREISKWEANPPTNIFDAVSNLTLDIICQSAFGISNGEVAENHPVMAAYKTLLNGLMMKFIGLGYFVQSKLDVASAQIESIAQDVLKKCREANAAGANSYTPSLIGMLLAAEEESDAPAASSTRKTLTDREIIDNIKIFLFAGHDSTASTILWTLYLLALNPVHLNPIRKEIEAFGDLSNQDQGTEFYEYTKVKMPYLQSVLNEVLRLYPPAWAINRSPKRDLVLGGYSIPKGTSIMINTLRMHRREDLGWEQPFEFMPERWTQDDDDEEDRHSKATFTYLPFGGGPRSCVGQPLAEIEMMTVISSIVRKFDPIIIGNNRNCDIDYFAGATIRPKNIANLRLKLIK